MGPERKDTLLSPDPKQRREQERSEVFAMAERLIAEGRTLRKKAEELVKQADALIDTFKRDHPEK